MLESPSQKKKVDQKELEEKYSSFKMKTFLHLNRAKEVKSISNDWSLANIIEYKYVGSVSNPNIYLDLLTFFQKYYIHRNVGKPQYEENIYDYAFKEIDRIKYSDSQVDKFFRNDYKKSLYQGVLISTKMKGDDLQDMYFNALPLLEKVKSFHCTNQPLKLILDKIENYDTWK